MSQGSNKKIANRLVALSSAAVLAVYSAGYARTKPAAARFAVQAAERTSAQHAPQRMPADAPTLLAAVATTPRPVASNSKPVAESSPDHTPAPNASPEPVPAETQVYVETAAPPPAAAPETISLPEQKVLSVPTPAPQAPPAQKWKDGTYLGWGTSRHGNIQAEVRILGGRIESAVIADCRTRYSCNVIDHLPPQVAQRQSADVDTVSRATQSADAFYWAVTDALSKAQ